MDSAKNSHEKNDSDKKSGLLIINNKKKTLIFINAFVFSIYTLLFSLYEDYLLFKQIFLILFFFTYSLTCNELKINYKILTLSFFIVFFSYVFLETVENNYHLIPVFYLVIFFFNSKDVSHYLKYFFLFTSYLVVFFIFLILIDFLQTDNLKSTSFIVIGLPGLLYIERKLYFNIIVLIYLGFSFFFIERQIFTILLSIIIIYFFQFDKSLKKLFIIIFFFKILFVLTLLYYAEEFYLNDLLNKRPLIFSYYIDFLSQSKFQSFIFGHGFLETKNDVFFELGNIFKFYRYNYNIFSPHNFLIITFYTYGLFGLSLIFIFIYKFFSLKKIYIEKQIMIIFMLLGVLQSYIFLGHQPLSIIFSLLLIIQLKNYKKNSS